MYLKLLYILTVYVNNVFVSFHIQPDISLMNQTNESYEFDLLQSNYFVVFF